ncbi:hypothetical protein AC579_1091 [Pseudocercospora musae]|uniref:Uncharacterized protein n=1 Tax=Pseudocercospora musae TaxID=113226 RepID=A0A139H8A9_9PEZI|nr:hypothetical protein AC579_1091 [Pseudocercospora musae]
MKGSAEGGWNGDGDGDAMCRARASVANQNSAFQYLSAYPSLAFGTQPHRYHNGTGTGMTAPAPAPAPPPAPPPPPRFALLLVPIAARHVHIQSVPLPVYHVASPRLLRPTSEAPLCP